MLVKRESLLAVLARTLTLTDPQLQAVRNWWCREGQGDDLVGFLVQQKIFSVAAPILFELTTDPVSSDALKRLFAPGGEERLRARLSESLDKHEPEVSHSLGSTLDEALVGLLVRVPPFQAEDAGRLSVWWQSTGEVGQLLAYLDEHGVLSPAAPIMLGLWQGGTTNGVDVQRFFHANKIPAFHASLMEEIASKENQPKTEVVSINDAPMQHSSGVISSNPTSSRSGSIPFGGITPLRVSVGSTLGKCLILAKVGQGASGTVYRALHQTLNIPVAVKILRSEELCGDMEIFRQFQSEARLLAQLNHPNVVRVWDFDDDPINPYLVLEYVEGLNVSELISQCGIIQPDRAVRIVSQVASGLESAWKLGIVHRDVKPGNILLTRSELTAKLADLGLATVSKGGEAETGMESSSIGFAGTAAYMAPEQVEGNRSKIDFRADIYALGCTFYQMLTGVLPFSGRTRMELLMRHSTEMPVAPHERNQALPIACSRIVLRMMEKKPSDRYGSHAELLQDLANLNLESSGPSGAHMPTQAGMTTLQAPQSSQSALSSQSGVDRPKSKSIWSRFFAAMRGASPAGN